MNMSHNKCKDVLLNSKCLRYSMNRIQSQDKRINKISLSYFDDKIHILSNGCDRLGLDY